MTGQGRVKVEPYVPMPVGIGWCIECAANVPVGANGRCSCGCLLIWRSDEPRPPILTEPMIALRRIDSVDRAPAAPMPSPPREAPIPIDRREPIRFVRRPRTPDGTPRWSTKFDACTRCGRTAYPHSGAGLCTSCRSSLNMSRRYREQKAATGPGAGLDMRAERESRRRA